tara:strand:+ start:1640 stop:2014 length:375 start_codon:yes stop_codon:yes gene_type:complete
MPRVTRGFKARRRRKKTLSLAKGYRGSRNNRFRTAVQVVRRALSFAYRDRKALKRETRRLWIVRINAAVRSAGLRYSEFIHGLKIAGVELDRSVLADMAIKEPDLFSALVLRAKKAFEVKTKSA